MRMTIEEIKETLHKYDLIKRPWIVFANPEDAKAIKEALPRIDKEVIIEETEIVEQGEAEVLFVETDEEKLNAFDPIEKSTMNKEILELVSVFLEEKGYDVDYTDGALYVNNEDTNTGVKISCEVIP